MMQFSASSPQGTGDVKAVNEINKGHEMKRLCSGIQRFMQDEGGTTSIEYGLLGSLIAVVIVLSVNSVGSNVCGRFKAVAEALGATGVADCR